jgi:hypothetical protein
MPAFNRADTILRSVKSVLAQTLTAWELIVVDDGSTDGTGTVVAGRDPRIRVIRQENQGITGARNTGLAASRGEYIAFLDSDDEWLPYHLEVCVGFLAASPGQHVVTTELLEDFGRGHTVLHYYMELARWYPELARRARSRSLDLPEGETDPYMRVYQTRQPLGPWGRSAAQQAGLPGACLYSGSIFEHLRWGYLMVMQATVITRAALEEVGPFDVRYKNVSDFGFMAQLCRTYRANYVALPTCIKHEFGEQGAAIKESHLSTGRAAVMAAQEMLNWFDELFWNARSQDTELCAIRATRQVILAKMCFERGQRADALGYLTQARSGYPGTIELGVVRWYVTHAPETRWSLTVWHGAGRARAAVSNLLRGHVSMSQVVGKATRSARAIYGLAVSWPWYSQLESVAQSSSNFVS